ncbi:MAG: VOC family protein [Burkholderiales bacterium]|jgi:hypothetical protein
MPQCQIDHITILSPSLAAGAELVHQVLGVSPQQGGEHPKMGTHNLLLRLGPSLFLEVIAINPDVPAPGRPRWFGLDQISLDSKPFLGCWVARTDDIHKALMAATEPLGVAESMTRGTLEWLISLPEEGRLPLAGTAPALIQWQTPMHPAVAMQDKACSLVKLELMHPEAQRLRALIDSLQFAESAVTLSVAYATSPGLVAHIQTPFGLRTLGSNRSV